MDHPQRTHADNHFVTNRKLEFKLQSQKGKKLQKSFRPTWIRTRQRFHPWLECQRQKEVGHCQSKADAYVGGENEQNCHQIHTEN